MPPSQLETLPEELLHYICEFLDSRKQSVHAFSLASKTCYTAALPTICRRICLVIWHDDNRKPTNTRLNLVPRIVDWLSLLDRRSANKHVRSLIVTQKQIDSVTAGSSWPEYLDTVDRDDALLVSPERECDWHWWSEPAEEYPTTEQCDIVWERLSKLIDRLPALASFTWDCSWPVPGQVTAALRLRPLVNLHLDSFWFADEMRVENTSPPELALLSDSRLHSIRSRSIEVVGYCEGDYTHEVILDLVSRINPHIRNVSFLADSNQHSPSGHFMYGIMKERYKRAPWPGLSRRDILRAPCARLQSLEIGPLSISLCQTVFHKCDLTDLKVLKLLVHYNYKGLDYIASSIQFPCLRSLVFGSKGWTIYQESEHGEKNLAVPFLSSLPALKAIRFIAQVDQDILENLAISIPRSLGDESEVAIYKCLGTFSRLSRLSLYLDCDDTNLLVNAVHGDNYDTEPVHYADFDDFDKEDVAHTGLVDTSDTRKVLNGHVRHALMNAALDKDLPRAVFDAIATSKPGLASDFPLQRLELRPIRGEYYLVSRGILTYLSQWWLVEAFAGKTEVDNPIVTPIRCLGDRDLEYMIPALPVLEAGLDLIFQKIWPRRSVRNSWYYNWCSVPLKTQ